MAGYPSVGRRISSVWLPVWRHWGFHQSKFTCRGGTSRLMWILFLWSLWPRIEETCSWCGITIITRWRENKSIYQVLKLFMNTGGLVWEQSRRLRWKWGGTVLQMRGLSPGSLTTWVRTGILAILPTAFVDPLFLCAGAQFLGCLCWCYLLAGNWGPRLQACVLPARRRKEGWPSSWLWPGREPLDGGSSEMISCCIWFGMAPSGCADLDSDLAATSGLYDEFDQRCSCLGYFLYTFQMSSLCLGIYFWLFWLWLLACCPWGPYMLSLLCLLGCLLCLSYWSAKIGLEHAFLWVSISSPSPSSPRAGCVTSVFPQYSAPDLCVSVMFYIWLRCSKDVPHVPCTRL